MARHLDTYFVAVACEIEARGMIAGPPQRSQSLTHLSGSIVIDCTAVRSAVEAREAASTAPGGPGGGADRRTHPQPVMVAWEEEHGWVVGLHLDGVSSSCRFPHPGLLPSPGEVAEFVVGLAQLRPRDDDGVPARAVTPGPARLRLVR